MAVSGKQYVPITAGRRAAGVPRVVYQKEASEQTALRGSPVYLSGGYATAGTTSGKLYGFLESDASNGASDGAEKSRILVAEDRAEFVGTLGNVTSVTQAMIGSYAQLSVGSSTYYLQTVATANSSIANCRIEGLSGNFVAGDAYPEVIFTVLPSFIQTV